MASHGGLLQLTSYTSPEISSTPPYPIYLPYLKEFKKQELLSLHIPSLSLYLLLNYSTTPASITLGYLYFNSIVFPHVLQFVTPSTIVFYNSIRISSLESTYPCRNILSFPIFREGHGIFTNPCKNITIFFRI